MTNSRHIPTLKSLTTLAASVAALGALAAPAVAKPVPYVGKTSSGTKITFKLTKGSVTALTTYVTSTCVSAQGGVPKVQVSPFVPPFKFRVGTTGKAKYTGWPTTYYTVTTQRAGSKITGKLESSWSMTVPSAWGSWKIDTCMGVASFSAKPR